MEMFHRDLINKNITQLIDDTNYGDLIHWIQKLDNVENRVVPPTLMNKWNRYVKESNNRSANLELYMDIQKRGPHAFELLVASLHASGQIRVARVLDASIGEPEEVEDISFQLSEPYSNEGMHYAFLDKTWTATEYKEDCELLMNLFTDMGYKLLDNSVAFNESPSVGSVIVVNFCSGANGGVSRENEWLSSTFQHEKLDGKPKILISLSYKTSEHAKGNATVPDAGKIKTFFKDILLIRIRVDRTNKEPAEISDEVKLLVKVLSDNDSRHIVDKMKLVQQENEALDRHSISILDSGFDKLFFFNKI